MAITPKKYNRKPLDAEAIQVTAENFLEVAFWCSGTIVNSDGSETDKLKVEPEVHKIQIRTRNPKHAAQNRAGIGDWILLVDRNFRVYGDSGFRKSFRRDPGELAAEKAVDAGKKAAAAVARAIDPKINDYKEEVNSTVNDHEQQVPDEVDREANGTTPDPDPGHQETVTPEPADPTPAEPTPEPHEPTPVEPATPEGDPVSATPEQDQA